MVNGSAEAIELRTWSFKMGRGLRSGITILAKRLQSYPQHFVWDNRTRVRHLQLKLSFPVTTAVTILESLGQYRIHKVHMKSLCLHLGIANLVIQT